MIYEGSCDTEDCSNDSALITEINDFLQYTQNENSYFKL